MNDRTLPDGYVLCEACNKAMPVERLAAHKETHNKMTAPEVVTALREIRGEIPKSPPTRGRGLKQRKTMNKTEARYLHEVLWPRTHFYSSCRVQYEGITFRLENGHRYTVDFVVIENGVPVECHEVKGGYKLHSQRSARMAFDQAKLEYHGIRWIWAVWNAKDKKWEIEE